MAAISLLTNNPFSRQNRQWENIRIRQQAGVAINPGFATRRFGQGAATTEPARPAYSVPVRRALLEQPGVVTAGGFPPPLVGVVTGPLWQHRVAVIAPLARPVLGTHPGSPRLLVVHEHQP